MSDTLNVNSYLSQIEKHLKSRKATEHTYRSALEHLIESLEDEVTARNEPKQIACGAPDLAIEYGNLVLGYIEAKDVGKSLDEAEETDQLERYKQALPNLILTDYLEFRWFVDGEHRMTAQLAQAGPDGSLRPVDGGTKQFRSLLNQVFSRTPEPIADAQTLAARMAQMTHMIHDIVVEALEQNEASDLLVDLRQVFADALVPNIDKPSKTSEFADMYAQTIAYGLFAARVNHDDAKGAFKRLSAAGEIPKTNPFLRKLFRAITGPDLTEEPYAGFVDDLVQLLATADIRAVLEDFGARTRQEDPVVHFYETFLKEYNPKLRELRGVYYTPEPVVSYITRSVDHLLDEHFNLDGLADTTTFKHRYEAEDGTQVEEDQQRVLVLDPACGTGTFLYHIVDHIRNQFMQAGNAGLWSSFVRDHLLPRLFGFELLMAPYAVAHLKLGMQLAGQDLPKGQRSKWSYNFDSDERLSLYLTNTLEDPEQEIKRYPGTLRIVSEEARAASEVKNAMPILVITGNPPYSNFGQMNNAPWISKKLMSDWKPRGEKKWNPDDFMKFMRWAEWKLNQSGQGVLAFITSRTYLDGITHRTMRQHLRDTFDAIYLLDLHGDIYETPPKGVTDENVFDITKGVAIGLFVKTSKPANKPQINYHELWGSRTKKYDFLGSHDVGNTDWNSINPEGPYYLFVESDKAIAGEYESFTEVRDIFEYHITAVQTARDNFVTGFSEDSLRERVHKFASPDSSDQKIAKQFNLNDTRGWKLSDARKELESKGINSSLFLDYLYRPFDRRTIYYSPILVDWPRNQISDHIAGRDNLGMLLTRSVDDADKGISLVADCVADKRALAASKGEAKYFYLYRYPSAEDRATNGDDLFSDAPGEREPNLTRDFIDACQERWGLDFATDGTGDLESTFGPEDVLHYAYAVFHSPTYRSRYEELLRIDYPRLPLTTDTNLVRKLCSQGAKLVELHLMEATIGPSERPGFPVSGKNEIIRRHPRYVAPGETAPDGDTVKEGRVYINNTQYFDGVEPEVWEFHIGGYQVCNKWLKDRKGRALKGFSQLQHYQNVVATLRRTMKRMAEIDDIIDRHGGWPLTGAVASNN